MILRRSMVRLAKPQTYSILCVSLIASSTLNAHSIKSTNLTTSCQNSTHSSTEAWFWFQTGASSHDCGSAILCYNSVMAESPLVVLVVDDEENHADVIAVSLEKLGVVCQVVHSQTEALKKIKEQYFDVIITDLMLERQDSGIEILKAVKQETKETEVVVITANNSVEIAVEAMRLGAFNYLQKPLDLKQLRTITERAAESSKLRRINRDLERRLDEKFGFSGVLGNSPQMLAVVERLRRVAPTDATVLIQGETGTGKELFAQSLHQNSQRKSKPFVALNCGALSENILESELFGHVKGAFTDASVDRIGKFEYANGGTMFLDEVGDMPMPTQIKLLRVLENGEVTRVGSNNTIKVNVRILSATNRSLEEAVSSGAFRQDCIIVSKLLRCVFRRFGNAPKTFRCCSIISSDSFPRSTTK